MLKKLKNVLKTALKEYNTFCAELGFDKGRTCRCAPVVNLEQDKVANQPENTPTNNHKNNRT